MSNDGAQFGDGDPRPVMSPESVEAAAGTARAQIAYDYLEPSDPAYPLPEGGFWGAFTRSLSGRWDHFKREHEEVTNTFDSDDADGQTRLVTDGGCAEHTEGSPHN